MVGGSSGFYNGAVNYMMRDIDPAAIIELVSEKKVTNALCVPAVIQNLLMMPNAAEADFSSMRRIVYGASPITEEMLVGAMNTFGCDFARVYGLTETTGGNTQLDPEDHDPGGPRAHLLRSAGKAVPGTELRIVETNGQLDALAWVPCATGCDRGHRTTASRVTDATSLVLQDWVSKGGGPSKREGGIPPATVR